MPSRARRCLVTPWQGQDKRSSATPVFEGSSHSVIGRKTLPAIWDVIRCSLRLLAYSDQGSCTRQTRSGDYLLPSTSGLLQYCIPKVPYLLYLSDVP